MRQARLPVKAALCHTRHNIDSHMRINFLGAHDHLNSQSSVRRSFAAAAADLGVINVLVYNAGGGGFGKTVMEIDPKEFIQSFNISCVGALNCAQVPPAHPRRILSTPATAKLIPYILFGVPH